MTYYCWAQLSCKLNSWLVILVWMQRKTRRLFWWWPLTKPGAPEARSPGGPCPPPFSIPQRVPILPARRYRKENRGRNRQYCWPLRYLDTPLPLSKLKLWCSSRNTKKKATCNLMQTNATTMVSVSTVKPSINLELLKKTLKCLFTLYFKKNWIYRFSYMKSYAWNYRGIMKKLV